MSGETEAAVRQLTSTLPKPVQRLYLQHDLTAVATGPLDPRIDGRLRTMAAAASGCARVRAAELVAAELETVCAR